jgi:hypothetical protein
MKFAVIGGTGLTGSQVVKNPNAAGHEDLDGQPPGRGPERGRRPLRHPFADRPTHPSRSTLIGSMSVT